MEQHPSIDSSHPELVTEFARSQNVPSAHTDMEDISSRYGSSIFFRRWAATIIDTLTLASLLIGSYFIVIHRSGRGPIFTILALFGLFIAYFLYYLLVEGLTGYTLGKFVLRIQVVNAKGQRPGFVKSFLRTLVRMIEVNPLLLGGLPAGLCVLLTRRKQRLGDMLADTYVVKARDLPIRGKTKNRVLALVFPVFFVFSVVTLVWGIDSYGKDRERRMVFISQDHQVQISAPFGWHTEKYLIDEKDDIAISNRIQEKYVAVYSDVKASWDADVTLEDYKKHIMDSLGDSIILQPPYELVISGYPAYLFEYEEVIDGVELGYIFGLIETPTKFYKIHAWTYKSRFNRVREEFLDIISSFRAVDTSTVV